MDCKMQHRIISVVLVVVISIFLLGGIAIARDFSADMVATTKDGVVTGKIFVAKEKTRMETPQTTMITRIDKNVVWILMPAQRMYMEQPLKPENVVATTDKMPGEIERKLVGKETVGGKRTDKYRIVYTTADKKETVFQWIAADSGLPIKSAAVDGRWTIEYKNLKTGKQPDSLFEIPTGYQKFSLGVPVMPETKAEEKTVEKEEKKPSKFPIRIPKLPGKFW